MGGRLRHVGIVVKDLGKAIQIYQAMGFKVVETETIMVAKLEDADGKTFELLQGNWKPHIAVNFYEDENVFLEVVTNE